MKKKLKRSYVSEQINKELENELKFLKTLARPVIEVNDQEVQTDDMDVPQQVVDREYELNLSLEIDKRTLRRMLAHKVEVLKLISQSMYYTFLALQNNEKQCTKATNIFGPLFTKWGPYLQLFDRLIPLLTQFKELPKGTIIPIRKMIGRVRDLNAFFIEKLQLIQNRMRFLIDGIQFFIPSILTKEEAVKGWEGWCDSFDKILEHPSFFSFCNDEMDITRVYEIIDNIYKVELDLNKFVFELDLTMCQF